MLTSSERPVSNCLLDANMYVPNIRVSFNTSDICTTDPFPLSVNGRFEVASSCATDANGN